MIPKYSKLPKSYQVLDNVIDRGEAVDLARILSVSPQLVRSWCRAPETTEEFTNTGKFNPLDRIRAIVSMIRESDGSVERAHPIGSYVANLLGGVFVPLQVPALPDDSEAIKRLAEVIQEAGEAVEVCRAAYFEDTPRITMDKKEQCRREVDEAIISLLRLKRFIDSCR